MTQSVEDLPAARSVAARHAEAVRPTILLVEDEEMVRNLISEALRRSGYNVWTCRDAAEAVEIGKAKGLVPELLLTDVVLPGVSGPELAKVIQAMHPGIGVIFMSGYPDCGVSAADQLHHSGYLQKPFTLKTLRQMVEKMLENRPRRAS